ncbi:TraI domain-containing protein [Salmonella enterica subsp. enterica serovar Reading]|nr:TraI domain-containing protein [Salmonella enterica subsp. enterica serovar Reading]
MFRKVKSWMQSKNNRQSTVNKTGNVAKISDHSVDGYFEPLSVPELLQHERRRQCLRTLWEYSALPKERFERYFSPPLHGVVSLCQRLPASAQGKFAYTDGMVDYILQTTVFAVRISKGYMLPRGATAEEQSAQSVSWSAVVYYAALFHSLGTLWNIEGELRSGAVWSPGLSVPEEPYRFRFKAEPDVAGAQVFGEMIAVRFLPEPVLQWLGKNPGILRTLLAFISGRYTDATDIKDIVNEAIVHAGGNAPGFAAELPVTLNPAVESSPVLMQSSSTVPPVIPVVVEGGQGTAPLLSSLCSGVDSEEGERQLSAETDPDVLQVMSILGVLTDTDTQVSESERGDTETDIVTGEPLPEVNIASGIQENRAMLPEQPLSEVVVPSVNTPEVAPSEEDVTGSGGQECTELSTDSVSSLSPAELGNLFWTWLRDGLLEGDIPVNTAGASVHLTCGFIFISVPAVFFLFLNSHSYSCGSSGLKESARKEQVQTAFERMRKHRTSDSRRFWQCCLYEEPGCRGKYKKLTGYLIKMSEVYAAGNYPCDSLFLKVIN